ncbi:MAG: cell division protein FtsA [Bacteroidales bacterium]|jgi:cell division protein FtsA|nr:cell division protein FtsA [Bacteroidales bacterium]MBR3713006.1 cell division protein FtsA [Bacteroidales bacterium]
MSKNKVIAAIDIGTAKIVVIVGARDEKGNVSVLGFGEAPSRGVIRGSVQNVGDLSSAISQAVHNCHASSGVVFKEVFVGIAGQNIRTIETSHTKFINTSFISQSDIDQLTEEVYNLNKEPGEEVIHVIPQSYMVDGSDVGLNVVGCPGKSLGGTFYVVIGRANAVHKIRQAIEMAQLKVVKIVLQSIASGDAVLTDDDKEVGTLVADIGAGTTDVAIYQDRLLRSISVIPFGGNSITEDIKSACQILARSAEALKIQHANVMPESKFDKTLVVVNSGRTEKEVSLADITAITNARMDEIVAGIANALNESKYGDKISQIAITGGGSKLKNLTTLVRYRLGRDVQQMKPRNISADSYPKLFNVEYSTAVGLLVKGIEYMEKLREKLKAIDVKPIDNSSDNKNATTQGDDSQEDKKPVKKPEKKSSLFSKLGSMLKDFFTEDEEPSKL